jgi:hypothetical protein
MSARDKTGMQPERAASASPSADLPDPELELTPRRTRAASLVVQTGAVAAAVTLFVLAGWFVEPVREELGRVGPSLPTLVYVGVLLVVAARIGLRRRPELMARIGRRRRLYAPAALASSTMAFLAPLFSGWETGRTPVGMAAGAIPYGDAAFDRDVQAPSDSVLYVCGQPLEDGASNISFFWPRPSTFGYFSGAPVPTK